MTSQQLATGGCLCGAVRYRIAAAPIVTRVCWCRVCQYVAAGNASVNCAFPSAAIQIEGDLRDYRSIFVRAGTLADANVAQPAMTIWTASAPRWACIDAALPNVPGQPPPAG